jgi:general secretion pathway protein G
MFAGLAASIAPDTTSEPAKCVPKPLKRMRSHSEAGSKIFDVPCASVRDALDSYKRLSDAGRIERAADGSGYPPTLNALVDGVTDVKSPTAAKLYFLRRLPRDPMEPNTAVGAESTWALRSYASPPDDPKEGKDVYDIHSKAPGTALDGTLYRTW